MFRFLISIGLISLVVGVLIERNFKDGEVIKEREKIDNDYTRKESETKSSEKELISQRDKEDFNKLFKDILNKDINKKNKESTAGEEKKEDKLKNGRKIEKSKEKRDEVMEKLQKGEYSIEEACNILNMEKGEILLLRNIYRK